MDSVDRGEHTCVGANVSRRKEVIVEHRYAPFIGNHTPPLIRNNTDITRLSLSYGACFGGDE